MNDDVTFGFASYASGAFELIVRNRDGDETTLHGNLSKGQLETVDRILPTCVFVSARSAEPYASALRTVLEHVREVTDFAAVRHEVGQAFNVLDARFPAPAAGAVERA